MEYQNTETRLDQLRIWFNEKSLNLIPVFQRGKVWPLKMRRELIKNIVKRRPIPAIFLYKDEAESGSQFRYNILDGKQRLESILMFIGSARPDFSIKTWSDYIYGDLHRRDVGFSVNLGDGTKSVRFSKLDDDTVREMRDYRIPTVEITLSDETRLDEMINLFVDINQYGVPVSRLAIVKAMKRKDPLLKDVFGLVALRQIRRKDLFMKRKHTVFSYVLKRLKIVSSVADPNAQADRMWEKLFELALFVRSSGRHRKPKEILASFIKSPSVSQPKLTGSERAALTRVFTFLQDAYKTSGLQGTRLATDQTQFYTMTTSLLNSDLLASFEPTVLAETLARFGRIIDESEPKPKQEELQKIIKQYLKISERQTTDVSRRQERGMKFVEAIRLLHEMT